MVRPDAFETNSTSIFDGLRKSLLESATFDTSSENYSGLLGLPKEIGNTGSFDPLSLVANRMATEHGITGNNISKLQLDFSTNHNSPVDYAFNYLPLFKTNRSFTNVAPKQPENATLDNATSFDLLTGKTSDTPNIGIASSDSLVVGGNNSSSLLPLLPDIIPPALTVSRPKSFAIAL